jgi:hypothetical protein
MGAILKFFAYAAKAIYDIRGLSDAINAATSDEELDELVLGKQTMLRESHPTEHRKAIMRD